MKVNSSQRTVLGMGLAALMTAGVVVAVSDGPAGATPSSGVTSQLLAAGAFDDIRAHARTDIEPGEATDFWQADLRTKGATDVQLVQNTVAPGGGFGWHSHPGPSLIIVKSGTATYYLADDPTCTPHRVHAGAGLVDAGSDTHLIRNEGTEPLVTVVASLLPRGAVRRIDRPAPSPC